MVDLAKYETLINDLSMIESEVAALNEKIKDNSIHKSELEQKIIKLKSENSALNEKIEELERELEEVSLQKDEVNFESLNTKERETLKVRIQDLISRIDYHLSSDRQI